MAHIPELVNLVPSVIQPAKVTLQALDVDASGSTVPDTAIRCSDFAVAALFSMAQRDDDAKTEWDHGTPVLCAVLGTNSDFFAWYTAAPGIQTSPDYFFFRHPQRRARIANPAVAGDQGEPAEPLLMPADNALTQHLRLATQLIGMMCLAKSASPDSLPVVVDFLVARYQAVCGVVGAIPVDLVCAAIKMLPANSLDKACNYLWAHPTIARRIILTVAESDHVAGGSTYAALMTQVKMVYCGAMMTLPKNLELFCAQDMSMLKLHPVFLDERRRLMDVIEELRDRFGDKYEYCRILKLAGTDGLNSAGYPFLSAVMSAILPSRQGTNHSYISKAQGKYDGTIQKLRVIPIKDSWTTGNVTTISADDAASMGLNYAQIQADLAAVVNPGPNVQQLLAQLVAMRNP